MGIGHLHSEEYVPYLLTIQQSETLNLAFGVKLNYGD